MPWSMAKNILVNLLPGVRDYRRLCDDLVGGRLPREPEPYLEALLSFARSNNPYYSPLLGAGASFEELPVLTKPLMREHFGRLKSVGVVGPARRNHSGGSTGKPQAFLQDAEYSRWNKATESYFYRVFLNVDPVSARKVVLWGSQRDTFQQRDFKGALINWLTNTIFLNTLKASEDDLERYIETIGRVKPVFVRGYAGSLHQIARLAMRRKLKVFRPRFLYSSAEMLHDWMRRDIEEVFGVKVHDFYGSREVGPIAGECRAGRKHIFHFNNLLEAEDGRLLVTNLHNQVMPLIRYDIGDTGALGAGSCSCGSPLPWLERLDGRTYSHFIKKDKTVVFGGFTTQMLYERDWVRQFQVTQHDFEDLEIVVVPEGKPRQEEMEDVERKLRFVFGADCLIRWSFVEAIALSGQGKHMFTRCLISG